MATSVGVENQPPRGEKEKPKNAVAEPRNTRALQDIGNFIPDRVAQGKPRIHVSHPVTRSFGAQLYAKAQAAEKAKKTMKEALEVKKQGAGGAISDQNVPRKPGQDDAAFAISSSEDARSKIAGKRLKGKKTFTSVMTARSKAASEIPDERKNVIEDIDRDDVDNELAVVEYIDDVYKFYRLTEDDGRVHDYMHSLQEINAKMRMILLDWLVEVHRKFELMPETLYLTINIVDRYLAVKCVRKMELQLVGISAMLIASKYEEIWAPEVNDFVYISDNAYVREQVLVMEKSILEKLEWYLTVPTLYVFLNRYTKASTPSDVEVDRMASFLAELGVTHYQTIISYCPSMIAASAVYAARCTLNKHPFWTETLKHFTSYSTDQVMDCAKILISFHSGAQDSKLKAVYRKYSCPDRGAVALLPPARTLSEADP
ncbi:hypothetical protein MLD38_040239 [Melastoma candidum]|uniref:Uncharacterized protein n=1 Tax=Melastoma candidum TaxID=119954 RepID=A0ACB9L6R7_9MYRT|nr:hypothetical protein MLD38_040239 [Melastoma candidum]